MTKEELILSLLEILKTWIKEEKERLRENDKSLDEEYKYRQSKQYKKAKQAELDAMREMAVVVTSARRGRDVAKIITDLEVCDLAGYRRDAGFCSLNDYQKYLAVINEAIKGYRNKVKEGKQ